MDTALPAADAEHYRRQLRTVAENATLALFIMDEHQHCTYMNRAAETLTGFTLDELRGQALHYHIHHTRPDGSHYPLEECPIDRAFPQNMREQGEEVFVHKDGHFYSVAFTASPIRDGDRIVGTIIEARDITGEKRRAEEEARRATEREALLRELEVERARLATVLREAPAMISVTRGPDHVLEMANTASLRMLGDRDLIGRPVRETMPEVAAQGFVELLDSVYRTGEPYLGTEVPVRLRRDDGTEETHHVNFVYQPLRDADGAVTGILSHGVDVTEQVEARIRIEEQAVELEAQRDELTRQAAHLEEVQVELEISNEELQAANEQLRAAGDDAARERAHLAAIIEHAPAGIVIARAPDGRIVAGNRRVEEIFRHPILQSSGVEEYAEWVAYHPDGRRVEGHEYPLARVFATGQVAGPDDYHYQRGDGTRAWVRITGAPVRDPDGTLTAGLVIIDDIDAQRRAEAERERLIAELEVGRARLEQIFSEAPAVMALYTGPEHVVTMVNPTWERTVGKAGALGRPFREVFPEFAPTGLFELLDRVYETGEPYVDPEVAVPLDRWGTGVLEDSYWNLVWRPLAGEGPQGRDILVHAVEVTSQVRARKEVEQKADELERLARALETSNRELDQFAYVASHDLKAPLRGISNISSWIEEDLGESAAPQLRDHLKLLRSRVIRMENLIEGILQYSRAGRVKEGAERVDTGVLAREAWELLAPPEGAALEVGAELPVLVTDRLLLQQVLMNLIGNAVKYGGGAGARVEVSARDAGGGAWEFAVRDHGPGIEPEYHERIFTIFQTLKSRDEVEGTGIGLSLVKKIVESRGGRVRVESAAGEGATFRFVWPAARGS